MNIDVRTILVSGFCLAVLFPTGLQAECMSVPVGDVTISPSEVWSPGHKPVDIVVEGRFDRGGADCHFEFGRINLVDEYNEYNQSVTLVVDPRGAFRKVFTINPRVNGPDRNGRLYRAIVAVRNQAGVGVAEMDVRALHHPERR